MDLNTFGESFIPVNLNTFKATWVNKHQFGYTCPYCWTRVNKNGKPRKNAKNLEHIHGNDLRSYDNRIEARSSHCPIIKGEIDIHITDETKRLY